MADLTQGALVALPKEIALTLTLNGTAAQTSVPSDQPRGANHSGGVLMAPMALYNLCAYRRNH